MSSAKSLSIWLPVHLSSGPLLSFTQSLLYCNNHPPSLALSPYRHMYLCLSFTGTTLNRAPKISENTMGDPGFCLSKKLTHLLLRLQLMTVMWQEHWHTDKDNDYRGTHAHRRCISDLWQGCRLNVMMKARWRRRWVMMVMNWGSAQIHTNTQTHIEEARRKTVIYSSDVRAGSAFWHLGGQCRMNVCVCLCVCKRGKGHSINGNRGGE